MTKIPEVGLEVCRCISNRILRFQLVIGGGGGGGGLRSANLENLC